VRIDACDGAVRGTWTIAWLNRVPRAARASMLGVGNRTIPVARKVVGPEGVDRDQKNAPIVADRRRSALPGLVGARSAGATADSRQVSVRTTRHRLRMRLHP